VKYFVAAGLFWWLSKTDPALAGKLWDLLSEAALKLREFILSL
jgi:hypothetical protein